MNNLRNILWPLVLVTGLASCGDQADVALTCENILPASEVDFDVLAGYMRRDCGFCHSASSPVFGYNFSTSGAAYESTAHKPRLVYFELAGGTMPQGGENDVPCADSTATDSTRWCEDKLKLFRSWYCHGALYD